jgi:hypothetical protein
MQNITNNLSQQPAAKIIVDGLFVLCVNEQTRTAQVGVYEYANDHDLFVRVSKKEHGVESELFKGGKLVKKLDDKDEIVTGDISISVSNRPADIAFYHHSSLSEESFSSDSTDLSSEIEMGGDEYKTDFRWIIDLEGARFHNRKLEVANGVLQRKITVANGVLYTEKCTSRTITKAYSNAALMAGIDTSERYYYVASHLGIAIDELADNEKLTITYGGPDKRKTLSLPKLDEEFYYEILISNNCRTTDASKKIRQTDFQCYYNFINVPVPERFELGFVLGGGNDFAPCDLIYLGQTPELP